MGLTRTVDAGSILSAVSNAENERLRKTELAQNLDVENEYQLDSPLMRLVENGDISITWITGEVVIGLEES